MHLKKIVIGSFVTDDNSLSYFHTDIYFFNACIPNYFFRTSNTKYVFFFTVLERKRAAQLIQDNYNPSLEQWLVKRAKSSTSSLDQPVQEEKPQTQPEVQEYALPACLMTIPNLPVSLLPPPPGSLDNLPIEEWG